MTTSTIRSRGPVVIPAEIRRELDLKAGNRLEFVKTITEGVADQISLTFRIVSLKGVLKKPAQPVSIEDMNLGIRRRARKMLHNSDH